MLNRNLLITSGLLLSGLFFPGDAFASVLSLSPSAGNITKGSTLTVQITLNTQGESVNAVTANLSYPADKLEVSASFGASAFSIAAEESVGGGSVRISRGSVSGASGNVNVATLKLKGTNFGAATISFVAGSAAPKTADSSDSLNLGGSRGGTYNITEATSSPAKPGSPAPETPKDTTPPKISEVNVSNLSQKAATISWKTDEPADSVVEYGLEKEQYFLNASKADLAIGHVVNLESSLLSPGLKVHYRVKSKDKDGNLSTSEDQSFKLKGFRVKVKVLDAKNKPVAGVPVTLYSEPTQSTTDSNGLARFEDIIIGKHVLVVKTADQEKTAEIEVVDNQDEQNFELKIDTGKVKKVTSPEVLIYAAIGFAIVFLSIVGVWLMIRRQKIS